MLMDRVLVTFAQPERLDLLEGIISGSGATPRVSDSGSQGPENLHFKFSGDVEGTGPGSKTGETLSRNVFKSSATFSTDCP